MVTIINLIGKYHTLLLGQQQYPIFEEVKLNIWFWVSEKNNSYFFHSSKLNNGTRLTNDFVKNLIEIAVNLFSNV